MAIRFVVGIFLVMIIAIPVSAQNSVSFGPQIGFFKAQDANGVRGMGGLALRLNVSEGIGIEGSINYRKERYFDDYVDVNTWPVMVTGLFYLAPVVYGAVGVGWYNTSIDYNIPPGYLGAGATYSTETYQEFGWHFGGGVEIPVTPAVKIIGDLKYVFLDYDFTNFPGSNGINSNFYVFTAGLLFSL